MRGARAERAARPDAARRAAGIHGTEAPYEPPRAPDLVLDTCASERDVRIDALPRFTLEARAVRPAGGARQRPHGPRERMRD
ncbi:hypothetical protein Bpla01_41870 [Burkholderia plantarii]|nr:hypothetical protein Bpla01_41870 [Burkholderia plantarii]